MQISGRLLVVGCPLQRRSGRVRAKVQDQISCQLSVVGCPWVETKRESAGEGPKSNQLSVAGCRLSVAETKPGECGRRSQTQMSCRFVAVGCPWERLSQRVRTKVKNQISCQLLVVGCPWVETKRESVGEGPESNQLSVAGCRLSVAETKRESASEGSGSNELSVAGVGCAGERTCVGRRLKIDKLDLAISGPATDN